MFSVNNLADDEKCKHYTGFPNYAVFIALFDLLKPGVNSENVKLVSAPNAHTGRGRRRRLSGKEQFLLTLMSLRRGFPTKHVEKSTVSRIFVSWVLPLELKGNMYSDYNKGREIYNAFQTKMCFFKLIIF